MTREFPRRIPASNIEIGDTISITRNLGNGIKQTLQGTIAERRDQGMTRTYRTAEGGVVVTWTPDRTMPRVTLLARASMAQVPLWSDDKDMHLVPSDNPYLEGGPS